MEITEVAAILSAHRFIPKPQHVIIIREPVTEAVDHIRYYRGLAPSHRSDTIVLSPQAIDETPLHEALHNLGLLEFGASVLGRILIKKDQVLSSFPNVKSMLEQPIRYEKCPGCQEFQLLHQKYPSRAEHYILVK